MQISSDEIIQPGLYIVATPIGNYEDITLRALRILKQCDIILCEDTRVTDKLLRHYGIPSKPLLAYHDHNATKLHTRILRMIQEGKAIALVSDAGTPLISDPGYPLVKLLQEEQGSLTIVPGVSSVITALTMAGLPVHRFHFEGFLPRTTIARRNIFKGFTHYEGTVICFETARRVEATLADLHATLPQATVVIARELTKTYEEVRRGTAEEHLHYYTENGPPRGEIILLFSHDALRSFAEADLDEFLQSCLRTMSVKDATTMAVASFKLPKKEIYARAVKLQKGE